MIYICIPSYNEAPTIGLLLWKIRQVFAGFPREYHLLVLDDGSSDSTAEVLERYTRVLPLTVTRHQNRRGYAESVEEILRQAVQRTDRPKRDAAVLMHADFTHNPHFIPDLVRRIESGADIVIGQAKVQGERSRTRQLVRRLAPVLLRGVVSVPGVSDLVSGFAIFRLVTLRNAFRNGASPVLQTEGWAANAELYGRTAKFARRVETLPTVERHDLRQRSSRSGAWEPAMTVWKARGPLRHLVPPLQEEESRTNRDATAQAEVAPS
ncbi:MAG: glycosyltransferase family 2 protein [Gemmatimonadales bacterium]